LNQVASASGLSDRLELDLLPSENTRTTRTEADDRWRELLLGAIRAVRAGGAKGEVEREGSVGVKVVFPGAFNPLHSGHLRMAEIAAEECGAPVEFEIGVFNVDKPPLDYTEIAARIGQFTADQPVWLTRAATFLEKSEVFPSAVFVVGIDTLVRVAEPRYYGGGEAARREAIRQVAERGCRFLVFGRQTTAGFRTLRDVELPGQLLAICQEVPEDRFRQDISSTQLRRRSSQLP
jgi:hypothetical protein